MELDLVGYRYGTDELGIIAGLLGYDNIDILHISVPGGIEYAVAKSSLQRAGILIDMDEDRGLDEITALLVGSLCSAKQYIILEEFRTVLIHPDGFYLLVQKTENGYILKPAQNSEDFVDEIDSALKGETIDITVVKRDMNNKIQTDASGVLSLLKTL